MSVRSVVGGTVRGLVIAAATAVAAFGALVVFDPFGGMAPTPAPAANAAAPAAIALQQRIGGLRLALRDTERQIEEARAPATAAPAAPDAALRSRYESQIAAAIERRDLALRHADAIRRSLDAGATPSSLAAIRDSVVIGQLLGQQSALDARIALESARLRPTHPNMLALTAQRNALASQIRQEAASIASALEAEARIDDAQIELLREQLPGLAPAPVEAIPDTTGLATRAAAQRAELDTLVDAYFNIPPATAVASPQRDLLSLPNLVVAAIAGLAAIAFQIMFANRRRRAAIAAADMAAWTEDNDPETATDEAPAPQRAAA